MGRKCKSEVKMGDEGKSESVTEVYIKRTTVQGAELQSMEVKPTYI